jgi:hypothetical protein
LSLVVPGAITADERELRLDFTSVSSKEIGRIHSEFAVRVGYAIYHASIAEADLIEKRRELKLAKARFIDKNQGKKFEVDAQAALEPEIKKLEDGIAVLERKKALIEGVIGAYLKLQEGSSREISRRENERTSRGD